MTHSLHREGKLESLEKDYAVYIFPARGFNYDGCAPRIRRLVEIVYQTPPANMIATTLRKNLYSGVNPDNVLDRIKEGCRVFAVFNGRDKINKLMERFKAADQGISIVISGLVDRVRDIAAEVGLNPHTINLSIGVHGKTTNLPSADIRQFTTMCGHGMVSPNLVRDSLRRIKANKTDKRDACLTMAKPCTCGIFNPHRSEKLLSDLLPLCTLHRW
jgi:hypothetical protein